MKNLVVGAGFSGAVIANLLASNLNEKVVVIDKKEHIAGNSYDYRDENGIMIHKYGSHIFHTNSEKVWKYLKQFTDFNTYMHKVIGYIDGIETHIPFNFNTLYDVFPETLAKKLEEKLLIHFQVNTKVPILEFQNQNDEDLKFLANYVYEKIFLHYTTKQWGHSPDEVDSAVTARVPVYLSKDNRYFQDKYQGIPLNGYTQLVKNILSHKNIEIKLNTEFNKFDTKEFDRIFYTGSIDEYFNYEFGELPYRSVNFKFETYDREFYQSNACVNYPCNYDFTRIHEYKYYLNDKSEKTVIAKEYSEPFRLDKNERYYPIPKDENTELYNKYLEKAKNLHNIYFLGRLGDYKYYNMDKAILRAIELFETIVS
ncbi:MAG: UDP-galactopyranose mutase [Candidatus Gastranaerophilales bacterium]|nr:UDP-galactopyranose mutase [Candidatus Gastranaerophilales bacterium]MCM1073734.1 UDP-galactopyranose mutase [Bacteroides sp.]